MIPADLIASLQQLGPDRSTSASQSAQVTSAPNFTPPAAPKPCPSCGRCPTCGSGGPIAAPYVQPHVGGPYVQPWRQPGVTWNGYPNAVPC